MNFQAYMMALNPESAAQVNAFFGVPQSGGTGIDNPYARIDPFAYSGLAPDENPGDKLYADLTRAQTLDYLQRFAPIEQQLVDTITPTGTTYLEGDLARTRESVLGAGMNVQGQQNRSMERLGLYGNSAIGSGNDTVGALVGGLNQTRMADEDRRMALLTGIGGVSAQRARGQV